MEKRLEAQSEARIQQMVWARLFEKDPHAGDTTDGEKGIKDAIKAIEDLEQNGFTIDEVRFEGSASSENVTAQEGDARLNDDDPENIRLAEKRAQEVAEKAFKIRPDLDNKSVISPGKEAKDPLLNQALYDLAG